MGKSAEVSRAEVSDLRTIGQKEKQQGQLGAAQLETSWKVTSNARNQAFDRGGRHSHYDC